MMNTQLNQEVVRIEEMLKGNFNPEFDCKTFYNDELTRMAIAILDEDFEKCPFQIDLWREVMQKSRTKQLEQARKLIDAEIARIAYCKEQVTGRKELVEGVYLSSE